MQTKHADVAVVGGGILGLATASEAARLGLSVVLFERDSVATGASIRNFGMVWPVGQPAGPRYDIALRSRARWLELGEAADIWVNKCGSLHLAYHRDELAVLEEFSSMSHAPGTLLTPDQVAIRSPGVCQAGLLAAWWSPLELAVSPRQAIDRLPGYLQQSMGVELRYGTAVTSIEMPAVHTTLGTWKVDRAIVCSGVDFRSLFPDVFADAGVKKCKLQMMRTGPQPNGWRLGPHLAAGLTLCHYDSFQCCPSLPALQKRMAATYPEYLQYGIHVMASQNNAGEIIIGDSHEYGTEVEPFDKPIIDHLILDYLRRFLELPDPKIAERWHGSYAKHPNNPLFEAEPQPGCHVLISPGGAGMTLSFGWAETLWNRWLGEKQPPTRVDRVAQQAISP